MRRALKAQLKLYQALIIRNFIIVFAGGLLGTVVFETIMRLSEIHQEFPTTFELATIASFFTCLLTILYTTITMEQHFNNAISMSCSRLYFLIGHYLCSLLHLLTGALAIVLTYYMERLRLRAWWSAYPCETNFSVFFKPMPFIICLILCIILEEFLGYLFLHYGKKAYWAIWILYMVGLLLIPRIKDAMDKHQNSLLARIGHACVNLYNRVSPVTRILILGILLLGILGITVHGIRREAVKS